jgi:hypothetical protein
MTRSIVLNCEFSSSRYTYLATGRKKSLYEMEKREHFALMFLQLYLSTDRQEEEPL